MIKRLSLLIPVMLICFVSIGCDDSGSSSSHKTGTGAVFDFESDAQDWHSEDVDIMAVTHNTDPAYIFNGSGSLRGACSITGTDPAEARAVLRYNPTSNIDLTGSTITFHVYIPESLAILSSKYRSKLWLGVGAVSPAWSQINGPDIDTPGWNTFTFTPSGLGEDSVWAVAIQISKYYGTEEDWSGDIYFDYFNW